MKLNRNYGQLFTILGIILSVVSVSLFYLISLNRPHDTKEVEAVSGFENILNETEKYQEKYFEIVKRHDSFLILENNKETAKDFKELKELFEEVKSKIDKEDKFLAKYEKIKNEYKENKGQNTAEINEHAKKKYDAFDKLLNETYKEIKAEIAPDEFEKLKLSQKNWLKEVEEYDKTFEQKDFGTIKTLVKLDYETNMRAFRALLLMLFLKKSDNSELESFLGKWKENRAEKYIDIYKKNNLIEVSYQSIDSPYLKREALLECRYDGQADNLICEGAKHKNQFATCKGISQEEDEENFLECLKKFPNEKKEDYETYSDDKIRALIVEKEDNRDSLKFKDDNRNVYYRL